MRSRLLVPSLVRRNHTLTWLSTIGVALSAIMKQAISARNHNIKKKPNVCHINLEGAVSRVGSPDKLWLVLGSFHLHRDSPLWPTLLQL